MTHRILVVDRESQAKLAQKNAAAARALFDTIKEALLGTFAGRTQVSATELEVSLNKVEQRWPKVETFFERAALDTFASLAFVEQDRRQDHLTRLIFARVLMKVPERPPLKAGPAWPRVVIPGLQANLTDLFTRPEWGMLNQHARWVFQFIGSDSDPMIISRLSDDPAILQFAEPIFAAFLLRFYRFNLRKSEFIRILGETIGDGGPRIGDDEFCELFEAIVGEMFAILRTEDGRSRIELCHGEEFLTRVRGVQDQYLRLKEGIAPASRRRRETTL